MISLYNYNRTSHIDFDDTHFTCTELELGDTNVDVQSKQSDYRMRHIHTTVGERDITLHGIIYANLTENIRDFKRQLQFMVRPKEELLLQVNHCYIPVRSSSSVEWYSEFTENNKRAASFTLYLTALDPYFKNQTFVSTDGTINYYPYDTNAPKQIGTWRNATSQIYYTINNEGDAPMPFEVKLTPKVNTNVKTFAVLYVDSGGRGMQLVGNPLTTLTTDDTLVFSSQEKDLYKLDSLGNRTSFVQYIYLPANPLTEFPVFAQGVTTMMQMYTTDTDANYNINKFDIVFGDNCQIRTLEV